MSERPKILVFCERIDNESFCESVVRELEAYYEVRAFGPGWPTPELSDLSQDGARFYLELDSASGKFYRPNGLDQLRLPKFAWLIDTHKKPDFHRALSREMDLTFFAMKNWGHVLEGETKWLPLHCDSRIFYPVEREREFDISFVGSYGWRAEPIERIAKKHGLKTHIECTTGPLEKTKTAEIYARSRLVFNRHVSNDLNFRVFEATACGRLLLTDAQWNGQYQLFDDGEHFVLYTDEKDLEEKILRYLRDDAARVRIERKAGEHAQENHTTRARVAQLRDLIESHLEQGRETKPRPTQTRSHTKRRWLFYVGEEAKTVSRLTYAESLAWALAERGDDVLVAKTRRGFLPSSERPAKEGEPRVVELEAGPLSNSSLAGALGDAAALHAGFERIASDFECDAIVGEGPLGALVAQPSAERRDVPFVLALDECEVARRKNRLTREQLYWAEVEQWGAERAAQVVVATADAQHAVSQHYRPRQVVVVASDGPSGETRGKRLAETPRLLKALGVKESGYTVFLTHELSERDVSRLLANVQETALVLTCSAVWAKKDPGVVEQLSRAPARGAVLAALLGGAGLVVALEPHDPRAREAQALGRRVQGVSEQKGASDVTAIDSVFERQPELVHGVQ